MKKVRKHWVTFFIQLINILQLLPQQLHPDQSGTGDRRHRVVWGYVTSTK